MTTGQPSAGWYPDPTGKPGQTYWDGQQWHTGIPAPTPAAAAPTPWGPAPYGGQPTAPPWTTTKTMALFSLIIGGLGILLDFFCGVGIGLGIAALVVGILAFNRAKTYNEPTGMAMGGMIVSGIATALGLLLLLFLGTLTMGGLGGK
jgi:hypothetical protein